MKTLVFSFVFLSASAAWSAKLEGRDAASLVQILHNSKILTYAGGATAEKDGQRLVGSMFDGSVCGTNEFKSLNVRVQTGRLQCKASKQAVWDIECILVGFGASPKVVNERGLQAAHLYHLLEEAKAPSRQGTGGAGGNATILEVPSLNCSLQGFNLCKGIAVCDFP